MLTERQRQVLQLLADGHTNQSAAREIGISYHTIRNYLDNIRAALDTRTKTQSVAEALRQGLIR